MELPHRRRVPSPKYGRYQSARGVRRHVQRRVPIIICHRYVNTELLNEEVHSFGAAVAHGPVEGGGSFVAFKGTFDVNVRTELSRQAADSAGVALPRGTIEGRAPNVVSRINVRA